MPYRLEVALKDNLLDVEGALVRKKAGDYFGINLEQVRVIHVITIDAHFASLQLEAVQKDIFTNPVTQISSYLPLPIASDWIVWVGYRPGVKDNPGSTAVEAIEDLLRIKLKEGEAV